MNDKLKQKFITTADKVRQMEVDEVTTFHREQRPAVAAAARRAGYEIKTRTDADQLIVWRIK